VKQRVTGQSTPVSVLLFFTEITVLVEGSNCYCCDYFDGTGMDLLPCMATDAEMPAFLTLQMGHLSSFVVHFVVRARCCHVLQVFAFHRLVAEMELTGQITLMSNGKI
jgi:hypothetical protein